MYADLIDSAVEQERRIAMERLVEAAVWTKETPVRRIATESGPDVIEGEYNVENITKVLTNTLENIEITGKAVSSYNYYSYAKYTMHTCNIYLMLMLSFFSDQASY